MRTEKAKLQDLSKEELIARVEKLEEEREGRDATQRKVFERTGRFSLWVFAGPRLFGATKTAWVKWFDWLEDEKRGAWPKEESGKFAAALLSRMMSIGLLSLLAVIAFPILQMVFLKQQNDLFQRQNNFIAFEQASTFRDLLFQLPIDSTGLDMQDYILHPETLLSWPAPSLSRVRQLASLGADNSDVVLDALSPLLRDNNVAVSSGALLAIHQIDSTHSFANANLPGANLYSVDLSRADLRVARLINANLFAATFAEVNLSYANLKQAKLQFARLNNADLTYADFTKARLGFGDFTDADLTSATLVGADLTRANLEGADLTDADLTHADLSGASLVGANLTDVDLTKASLRFANLANADLTFTKLSGSRLIIDNLRGLELSPIENICVASYLNGIQPDALLAQIQKYCPEKLIPPQERKGTLAISDSSKGT